MAVAVRMGFRGVTLKQFQDVVEDLGCLPGGPSPTGALFQWAVKDRRWPRLVDVWETREALELFVIENATWRVPKSRRGRDAHN